MRHHHAESQLDRASLVSDLRALGLRSGATVMVHAAFRALRVRDPETVILALLDVLGDRGTLLMPALSWLQELPDIHDTRATPSCVGFLAASFRTRPGTRRSLHPTHSVSGVGARATELLQAHRADTTPCGPYSPFSAILHGGVILFLFYLEKHGWIYAAALACYNRRVPPDIATLSDELRRCERLERVGGIAFLGELVAEVPTAVHIAYYAAIVERTAVRRKLIETGGKIAALGYAEQDDLQATLDQAEAALFAVSDQRTTSTVYSLGSVVNDLFRAMTYHQDHRGEVSGVPSGYDRLDELTGGFQPTDSIILAARPSNGKTSRLCQWPITRRCASRPARASSV
jgi:Aminoglycoside 3-N-acetyltransferase/DnaB-like helicase N terminal domain/DnaB-like helicase C terminal domain